MSETIDLAEENRKHEQRLYISKRLIALDQILFALEQDLTLKIQARSYGNIQYAFSLESFPQGAQGKLLDWLRTQAKKEHTQTLVTWKKIAGKEDYSTYL